MWTTEKWEKKWQTVWSLQYHLKSIIGENCHQPAVYRWNSPEVARLSRILLVVFVLFLHIRHSLLRCCNYKKEKKENEKFGQKKKVEEEEEEEGKEGEKE